MRRGGVLLLGFALAAAGAVALLGWPGDDDSHPPIDDASRKALGELLAAPDPEEPGQ